MLWKWRNMPRAEASRCYQGNGRAKLPLYPWGASCWLCLYQVGMQANPLNTCTPLPMARKACAGSQYTCGSRSGREKRRCRYAQAQALAVSMRRRRRRPSLSLCAGAGLGRGILTLDRPSSASPEITNSDDHLVFPELMWKLGMERPTITLELPPVSNQ